MNVPNTPWPYMNCIALLLALSLLYGCGGVGAVRTSSTSPPSQPLSVTVAPLAVDLRAGDTQQFSATVSGSTITSVTPVGNALLPRPTGLAHAGPTTKRVIWSINGVPGGNAALGTINAKGLYISPTTPPDPNAVEVTASSVVDPSISQTALLTLYNPIPTVTSVTPSKVSVGGVTLTVSGRNFVEGAQVLFAGTAFPTTFSSSTQLIARGVAAQPGSAQVQVRNPEPGSANSAAALIVQVMPPVTPAPASWNPAVLGVPWASDFVAIAANQIDVKKDSRLKVKATGDGVTDDTSPIRAAIKLASSSGGGVVYFPAGDYKIVAPSDSAHGNPLAVPSRVILRGASATTSRLFVNDPDAASGTDGTWTWGGIDFQGSSLSGMTDLGVYAVNSSASPCALLWNRGSSKVSKLFFNNLDVRLENCRAFWFEATDNLLVRNSHFDSNSSRYGPIYVVGNSHISFLGNTINYHFGRVQMQNNIGLLIQHNTLIRDAQNKDMEDKTAIESGGVEISFGQQLQVLDNTIQTLNAPPREAADGEAIMSQQSTTQNVLDAGSVTSITSTTLTDANALWGRVTEARLAKNSEVVAILTGPGTGQWRKLLGINTSTKTLTLDQPWSPVPEVGSLYSIFAWTLIHANIQGNKLIDNPNGIVLYDGCYDCAVQNNVLTNSRGIVLRAIDEALSPSMYPEGRRVHQVAIKNTIVNNKVSNTSGLRPAYIALDTEAFDKNTYRGAGVMDVQVAGNVIEPYSANPNQTYIPKLNEITQEGLFPCFLFGPAKVKDGVTTVFQRVHVWNNSQSVPVSYGSNFLPLTTHACVTASAPPTNTP
jgi:parallel beta-helix repeat protein